MFDWLFEGHLSVYVFLLLVGCVLLVLWWQRRDRRLLYAVGAVLLAALLYRLLDVVRETPQEKVEAAIKDMADAAGQHDLDRLFGHVSDSFRHKTHDKKSFRGFVERNLNKYDVKNVRILNLRFLEKDVDAGRMKVRFDGKADTALPWNLLPCEIDFVREGDGQWRMKAIRFYDPVLTDQEWDITGL